MSDYRQYTSYTLCGNSCITDRLYDSVRKEPNSDVFDPLRAACLYLRDNNYDEACWLVFLATHFGKRTKNRLDFVSRYIQWTRYTNVDMGYDN
ncbi:hypothetical protein ACLB1M_28880 [Escherichia coli]